MAPKIRNIIIFVIIGTVLILIYIFFIRSSSDQSSLVSSTPSTTLPSVDGALVDKNTSNGTALVGKDFLTLLLNVKTIKLDDVIFSDPAFISLHDSSIILTPDGTEGRSNPFAQFGTESTPIPVDNTTNTNTPTSTTPPKTTSVPTNTNTPTSTTPPKTTSVPTNTNTPTSTTPPKTMIPPKSTSTPTTPSKP